MITKGNKMPFIYITCHCLIIERQRLLKYANIWLDYVLTRYMHAKCAQSDHLKSISSVDIQLEKCVISYFSNRQFKPQTKYDIMEHMGYFHTMVLSSKPVLTSVWACRRMCYRLPLFFTLQHETQNKWGETQWLISLKPMARHTRTINIPHFFIPT